MNPDIFIDDFEITENTEELHAIFGRCIIIATRFDNLCDHTAKYLKIKTSCAALLTDSEFENYANELLNKYSTLNKSINSLPVANIEKSILHNARVARNEIAHGFSRNDRVFRCKI